MIINEKKSFKNKNLNVLRMKNSQTTQKPKTVSKNPESMNPKT